MGAGSSDPALMIIVGVSTTIAFVGKRLPKGGERGRRARAAERARGLQMSSAGQAASGTAFERWFDRNLRILMLAPAMIILAGLTLFPTIYMFTAAFQKISANLTVPPEFVGIGNFVRLLTDEQFHVGLLNTLI